MAKFYGNVGYIVTEETEPGIWEEVIKTLPYCGDLTRNTSKFQVSGGVNDDISISNTISIIADPYAEANFQHMRFVEFMGAKWKITNVEVQHPRLLLTIGGLYHEQKTTTSK